MKKIIMIVLILALSSLLIFEFTYLFEPDTIDAKNTGVINQNLINKHGEYEFTNGSYIIGQDIPVGSYELLTKSEDVAISVVNKTGNVDISDTNVGQKIVFEDSDSAIIVSNGKITLK